MKRREKTNGCTFYYGTNEAAGYTVGVVLLAIMTLLAAPFAVIAINWLVTGR